MVRDIQVLYSVLYQRWIVSYLHRGQVCEEYWYSKELAYRSANEMGIVMAPPVYHLYRLPARKGSTMVAIV